MSAVVVADDLSGAAECQARLWPRYTSVTRLDAAGAAELRADLRRHDVAVVDAHTRALPPDEAARALEPALAAARAAAAHVYLKLDSTLRGPIGAAVEAAVRALDVACLPVVLANPRSGRQTLGGVQQAGGRPVHLTPFADDPTHPVRESRIATLLRGAGLAVEEVPLAAVRGPRRALAQRLATASVRALVFDAEEPEDLARVARAVGDAGVRAAAGSAGLLDHLDLGAAAAPPPPPAPAPRRVLVVVGSRHPVAAAQVEALRRTRGAAVVAAERGGGAAAAASVARALAADGCAVLAPPRRPLAAGEAPAALAEAAAAVERLDPPDALVLVGGSSARAVCGAIGVEAFELVGLPQPELPLCRVTRGAPLGRLLLPRPGGFGSADALADGLGALADAAVTQPTRGDAS